MATVVDCGMVTENADILLAVCLGKALVVYLLSPATFLTKICIVSSASADEARELMEEMLDMLLERILMVVWSSGCGTVCLAGLSWVGG